MSAMAASPNVYVNRQPRYSGAVRAHEARGVEHVVRMLGEAETQFNRTHGLQRIALSPARAECNGKAEHCPDATQGNGSGMN
jgi:hypothetical protein